MKLFSSIAISGSKIQKLSSQSLSLIDKVVYHYSFIYILSYCGCFKKSLFKHYWPLQQREPLYLINHVS